jgi:hypothetical protein
MPPPTRTSDSPATLVAIIAAARRAGDRELEREARRRLEEQFGMRLTIIRERDQEEVAHHAG